MAQFLIWSVADFGASSLSDLFAGTTTITGTPSVLNMSDDDNSFDDFFGNGGQTQDPGMNQILTADLVIDGTTVGSTGDGIYNAAEGLITNNSTGETGRLIYVTVNGGSIGEFVGVATTIPINVGDSVTTAQLTPFAEEAYSNLVACFTAGTCVDTPQGPVAVETLAIGDIVLTKDNGPQPVRWIGRRFMSNGRLELAENLQPIFIERGALGPDHPKADLLFSPNHRILLDQPSLQLLFGASEVLVSCKSLLENKAIKRVVPDDGVEYIHLMFDRHEILTSHGLESESFHPLVLTQYPDDDDVRDELFTLFPELRDDPNSYGPTARMTLKPYEAKLIRSNWKINDPKTAKTFSDPEWSSHKRVS